MKKLIVSSVAVCAAFAFGAPLTHADESIEPPVLPAHPAARHAPQSADQMGDLIERVSEPAPPPAPAAVAPVGNLWDRIRRGFKMPELQTAAAFQRTRWYAAEPEYMQRMVNRSSLYLYHIVEEIERRGMPTELALLPFVESAMQPEAVSSAKAAGLWQFIPSTGRHYALEQNLWKDERRDVIESTRAALDYLQKLYNDFGDWHLALAAYNMGEGGLARAIARNRAARKPTDYSSLRIPRETQGYVPKLQAIKNIVRDPARYDIELPLIRDEPYFVALTKTRDIDVATAAKLAGLPLNEFRALNPAFNRPVIVGASSPTILLPADKAVSYLANLAAYEATGQPLASWAAHTMRSGETLQQVAQRVGVSEAQLREANNIPPRYRVASGSTILIPRDETMSDDIARDKLAASVSYVPEQANLRQLTYRVRRGDTLHSVARRWKVQPQEIVAWNNLRSQQLFAGQRLNLTVAYTPAKSRKTASKATATKKNTKPTNTRSASSVKTTTAAAASATRR